MEFFTTHTIIKIHFLKIAKSGPFSNLRSHKTGKKAKYPKSDAKVCSWYHKEHLYQFIGQLDHFPLNAKTFSGNFCFQICLMFLKKWAFCPKIGQFSAKISKILGINKSHLNTSYVIFLGHLEHYWQFFGYFRLFLGHFWPY